MPKRSRSGLVSMPARVVAPTRVNGGRSSLTERAAGPSPIMMSIWKSSSAGYSTSSTTGERRWISSMKRTSCGSRLVSSAARSPARSSTGPEVWRRLTPISRAMMCASVVLPSPGGPNSSTWSSASLRLRAAWMKISSCSRALAWPTYSAKVRGRSARSICSSCGLTAAGAIRRSVSIMKLEAVYRYVRILLRGVIHRRCILRQLAAPARLRLIERAVGTGERAIERVARGAQPGLSRAETGLQIQAESVQLASEMVAQAQVPRVHAGRVEPRQQHRKLVSRQTRGQVGAPGQRFQRLRQGEQDLVAHPVPVAVVDPLEMVDVEHDQGDSMLPFGEPLCLGKTRFECAPVGKPRERIGQAQVFQPRTLLLQMQGNHVDVGRHRLELDVVRHDRGNRLVMRQRREGVDSVNDVARDG